MAHSRYYVRRAGTTLQRPLRQNESGRYICGRDVRRDWARKCGKIEKWPKRLVCRFKLRFVDRHRGPIRRCDPNRSARIAIACDFTLDRRFLVPGGRLLGQSQNIRQPVAPRGNQMPTFRSKPSEVNVTEAELVEFDLSTWLPGDCVPENDGTVIR